MVIPGKLRVNGIRWADMVNAFLSPLPWLSMLDDGLNGQLDQDATCRLVHILADLPATDENLLASWQLLSKHSEALPTDFFNRFPRRVEVCGTGGSGLPHFNTSTVCAFVLAGAGLPVVKFGNRAATSQAGSFDFLDALGLCARPPLSLCAELLAETGLVFLYAPQVIQGLAHLATARKQVGRRTLLNLLGPLLNPARPTHQLVGISNPTVGPWMAGHLKAKRITGWVVCGHANQDDLTPWGQSHIWPSEGDAFTWQGDMPFNHPMAWTVQDSVSAFDRMLNGEDTGSPVFRQVCLNAGAVLALAGHSSSWQAGALAAKALFADGAVKRILNQVRTQYARLPG